MNTRQTIELEDRITALEAENAVKQRTIDDLETQNATLEAANRVNAERGNEWERDYYELKDTARTLYAMITEFDLRAELSYAKESDLEYITALTECNELFPDDEPERCACGNNDIGLFLLSTPY